MLYFSEVLARHGEPSEPKEVQVIDQIKGSVLATPNNASHKLSINLPTPVSSYLLLLFFTIEACTLGI